MKIIILISIMLFSMGCSTTLQQEPKKDTKITSKKEKNKVVFSVDEYKHLSKKGQGIDEELSIGQVELNLLNKSFTKSMGEEIKPLVLEKEAHHILDILKDKNFDKFYNVKELDKFVYKGNKAIGIFLSDNLHNDDKESGSGYCVGGGMYLFYLNGKKLNIKYLDGFSGEIAPVIFK